MNPMNRLLSTARQMLSSATVALATGLGAGLSPFAPGTVGCLWGIPISALLKATQNHLWEAAGAGVLVVLAVPICSAAETRFGKKDDRRIVADEFMTFPVCLLGLPLAAPVVVVAFVLNRFLDVLKPPPARRAQQLPRGWGVVADDLTTSLYTLGIMHILHGLLAFG